MAETTTQLHYVFTELRYNRAAAQPATLVAHLALQLGHTEQGGGGGVDTLFISTKASALCITFICVAYSRALPIGISFLKELVYLVL